jgi:hypothetical protein
MQFIPDNIFDYVFGDSSGHAGIGCITGEAGCEIKKLDLPGFITEVKDWLDNEDFDTTELRAELATEADALFAEYASYAA